MGKQTSDKVLFLHRNGQWTKKHKGKAFYFGTDYDKAVDDYLACKEHILARGCKPKSSGEPTLSELANVYHNRCRNQVSRNKMGLRSMRDIKRTIDRLIVFRGAKDIPAFWEPLDYADIVTMLYEPIARPDNVAGGRKCANGRRSSLTVDGDIRRIKAFLYWCHEQKLLPKQPEFGEAFDETPASTKRQAKSKRKGFEAAELRAIIEQCNNYFKPVVLLGLNGGMGALDIALLTLSQLDGSEWLDAPRNKTGAPRKIWLWPETRKAIKHYLTKVRKEPWAARYSDVALLTMHRTPWVEETLEARKDAATQAFSDARKAAGVERGAFYDLRRQFKTVGSQVLDTEAVEFCMGHAAPESDVAATYLLTIGDDRIKRVCAHVRKWLYGK